MVIFTKAPQELDQLADRVVPGRGGRGYLFVPVEPLFLHRRNSKRRAGLTDLLRSLCRGGRELSQIDGKDRRATQIPVEGGEPVGERPHWRLPLDAQDFWGVLFDSGEHKADPAFAGV